MEISFIQAALIGILYYLTVANSPWFTGLASVSIRQPLVAGTIVGLILGKPTEGLIIGATINVAFIGFISPGGAVASEPGIAGIVGTALAIMSNATPDVAISLAVPFGLLGTLLWNIRMTANSFFVNKLDKCAQKGDIKKMLFIQLVPAQIFNLLLTGVPVFLVLYVGGPAVSEAVNQLTGTPLNILKAIGGVLPAVGIILTLRMISNRKGIILFFIFGYYLAVYSGLPIIMLALFGLVFAYVYTTLLFKGENGNGE